MVTLRDIYYFRLVTLVCITVDAAIGHQPTTASAINSTNLDAVLWLADGGRQLLSGSGANWNPKEGCNGIAVCLWASGDLSTTWSLRDNDSTNSFAWRASSFVVVQRSILYNHSPATALVSRVNVLFTPGIKSSEQNCLHNSIDVTKYRNTGTFKNPKDGESWRKTATDAERRRNTANNVVA